MIGNLKTISRQNSTLSMSMSNHQRRGSRSSIWSQSKKKEEDEDYFKCDESVDNDDRPVAGSIVGRFKSVFKLSNVGDAPVSSARSNITADLIEPDSPNIPTEIERNSSSDDDD